MPVEMQLAEEVADFLDLVRIGRAGESAEVRAASVRVPKVEAMPSRVELHALLLKRLVECLLRDSHVMPPSVAPA